MEISIIILGGICLAYVFITQILEWLHHMDVIKERWPGAYKKLMSPVVRVLMLLVAIGLFAEVLREHRREAVLSSEPSKASAPSRQTGPATTNGDNSPAVTGDENKFNYTTPDKDKK